MTHFVICIVMFIKYLILWQVIHDDTFIIKWCSLAIYTSYFHYCNANLCHNFEQLKHFQSQVICINKKKRTVTPIFRNIALSTGMCFYFTACNLKINCRNYMHLNSMNNFPVFFETDCILSQLASFFISPLLYLYLMLKLALACTHVAWK